MPSHLSFALACLVCIVSINPVVDARIFTDQEGRTIDAELIAIYQDQVTFRKLNESRTYSLPLSAFSAKDQHYITTEKAAGRLTLLHYQSAQKETAFPVVKDKNHIEAAARIDRLLDEYRRSSNVQAAPRTEDSTFLRRSYLKIIGRIPTHAEAVHFLNNKDTNKRVALVDQLLDSTGYNSHNFNLWADVLRAKSTGREGSLYGGIYYVSWLKQQIRENVPYDHFVRSLITAEGYPWENPASAYYLRDYGMPLDNMSITAQIFLGTQLQCAQCHDHPTDQWTQKDFYELSAFRYKTKTGINLRQNNKKVNELASLIRVKDIQSRGNASKNSASLSEISRELLSPMRWGVQHSDRQLRLPSDYQYDNAHPFQVVEPKVLFGELPQGSVVNNTSSLIDSYAEWMTSKQNPRFTKVIANRMWKHVMGIGLFEPIDQYTDATEPQAPELLDYLESLMIELDYDLKQFQRVLLITKQFQRKTVIDDPDLPNDYHLEGPVIKRMSSEQLWDSLAILMDAEIDHIKAPDLQSRNRYQQYSEGTPPAVAEMLKNNSAQEIIAYIESIQPIYQEFIDARSSVAQKNNPSQTTSKINKRRSQKQVIEARKNWIHALNRTHNFSQMSQDYKSAEMNPMAAMMNGQTTKQIPDRKTKHSHKNIYRASELSSPAPKGHLLEVFGQSDRELVENANYKSTLTQALFLMNSKETNQMLAHQSAPVLEARIAKTPEEKLEAIYIGFLARKPTNRELETLLPNFRDDPEKARERIIWAMLNTGQFIFIQ